MRLFVLFNKRLVCNQITHLFCFIFIFQPTSILSAEEDAFIDLFESQTKQNIDVDMGSSDLLSIDQLLESVHDPFISELETCYVV